MWQNVKHRYQTLHLPTKQDFPLCVFKSKVTFVRTWKFVRVPSGGTEISRVVIQETSTAHPQVDLCCVV